LAFVFVLAFYLQSLSLGGEAEGRGGRCPPAFGFCFCFLGEKRLKGLQTLGKAGDLCRIFGFCFSLFFSFLLF
jgi:hypothetical protein